HGVERVGPGGRDRRPGEVGEPLPHEREVLAEPQPGNVPGDRRRRGRGRVGQLAGEGERRAGEQGAGVLDRGDDVGERDDGGGRRRGGRTRRRGRGRGR